MCFISLSSNISTRSIGRPIQLEVEVQVPDRDQSVLLSFGIWYSAEQEWTTSFTTGGFCLCRAG